MWQVFLPLCKLILTPPCPKSPKRSFTVPPPPCSPAALGRGPSGPPSALFCVLVSVHFSAAPPISHGGTAAWGCGSGRVPLPSPGFKDARSPPPRRCSEMADRRCARPRSHREGLGEAAAESGQLPSQTRGRAGLGGGPWGCCQAWEEVRGRGSQLIVSPVRPGASSMPAMFGRQVTVKREGGREVEGEARGAPRSSLPAH